ncbi:YhgE/Pip domain-containing protein [Lysinibacillus antri]|uniref:ABC-2 type transporter transmembrane domain-containing protein n=1 Tax=Lysinibacillus antri TaxID=2498145 RepID=A0A3S0R5K4_9BACI|nr:ABC transporter permease [Lysinibacillus antri]RUL50930.1 hypothetical protein EK386_13370 [Lysinibacillus antri]
MRLLFKNKLLWIGLGIIILATSIITFAFMGSSVNPTPKKLPIAVVIEDKGIKLPSGEEVNFGEMLLREINKKEIKSIEWKTFEEKEEAITAMNNKELYVTIVLPEKLSQYTFSLLTDSPTKPETNIIINEGMNQVGVNLANQIAKEVLANFNQQIQLQFYTQIEEMKVPLTINLAKLISDPITIKTEKVNTVPVNNANGNTPAIFTQILWLGTFISAMLLFTIARKLNNGSMTMGLITGQILSGILYTILVSSIAVLLAVNILDVDTSNGTSLFFAMFTIGFCFFLLQSALLNLIGYIASPILILLFLFAMPILTMAPEMLPNITKDYLYSWVPFRFSLEELRDILFFNKDIFENGMGVIGGIGVISLVMMGLSALKSTKRIDKRVENNRELDTSNN